MEFIPIQQTTRCRRRSSHLLTVLVILPMILFPLRLSPALVSAASSTTAALSSGRGNLSDEERERARAGAFRLGMRPDPFVAASPLIVAAVCKDGVAMVAAHTVSTKEPLLRDVNTVKNTSVDAADNIQKAVVQKPRSTAAGRERFQQIYKDISVGYGGPFRIHKLDGHGSTLLAAGWRADCDTLSGKCRAIAAREVARFGSPPSGIHYGRYLASEASYCMAQCAGSESMRALSCVGLLVGCNGGDVDGGSLWLVDSTGVYRVRALACGGGKMEGAKDEQRMVAHLVNKKLQATDFDTMTASQGVAYILRILTREDQGTDTEPLVPADSEIEIAMTDSGRRKLHRIRLSSMQSKTVEIR